MKIVGLIPFWMQNKCSRDVKKLAGKYLIEYSIELLNNSCIDETIIYASDEQIFDYIHPQAGLNYLKRPSFLDNENICLEDIIKQFLEDYDCDIIVLLHPYSPFIQKETLNECITKVKSGEYDSSFTAQEYKKFAWYKGTPINFELNKMSSRLSSLESVIIEQGLLYIISKDTFNKKQTRIGNKPFIKLIDNFEGHEVNNIKDYEVAELIINSGMYPKENND